MPYLANFLNLESAYCDRIASIRNLNGCFVDDIRTTSSRTRQIAKTVPKLFLMKSPDAFNDDQQESR